MARWEYLIVQLGYFGMNQSKMAPQFVNGKELPDWKRITLSDHLALLGKDGWEMSGAMNTWIGTINHLFFKRPIP